MLSVSSCVAGKLVEEGIGEERKVYEKGTSTQVFEEDEDKVKGRPCVL